MRVGGEGTVCLTWGLTLPSGTAFMRWQSTFTQSSYQSLRSLSQSLPARYWRWKNIDGRRGFQRRISRRPWSFIRRGISSSLKAVNRACIPYLLCLFHLCYKPVYYSQDSYCRYKGKLCLQRLGLECGYQHLSYNSNQRNAYKYLYGKLSAFKVFYLCI